MGDCRCSSKKHGHGDDLCGRPTLGDNEFCEACQEQIRVDQVTQANPKLTPTHTIKSGDERSN
jgi:hypothetical protein